MDVYQGAVPALVPFLVAERGYGYVAVSGVVLAATLLSSVVQPVFGALADRWRMPWLIPASMVTAGLGVALSGVTDSYALTWLAVALSGLGVAAYHPESARLARIASAGSHVRMSWFSLGGTLGFASAPVLVTPLLAVGGLGASPWLVVPGGGGRAGDAAGDPGAVGARRGARRGGGGVGARRLGVVRPADAGDRLPVGGVRGAERFRGPVRRGAGRRGWWRCSCCSGGGAVGTVLGGRLAARWGRVRAMRAAYAASVPAVAGVVLAPGPLMYVFVAAAAITLYAPFSLHVTLGQDYLPRRVGTAGGVTLGLAVSAGGLASPLVGWVAETVSLRVALGCLALVAIPAWLLSRTLAELARPAVTSET
ncbi:MFS transporter [Nonomuraea ferruginea]